jgi:hypothetical protein
MTVVWSLPIGPTDKLVLLALADNANDEGFCWPSIRTLESKTSLSNRTVRYSIKRLKENGHLVTQNYNGHSLKFTLTPRQQMPTSPAAVAYLPRHQMPQTPAPDAKTPAPDADITIKNRQGTKEKRVSTLLPDDFGLNPKREEFAKVKGKDPEATLEAFKNYYQARGTKFVDWDAAWRGWCGRKFKDDKTAVRNNDAAWAEARSRAKAIDFRDPWPKEAPASYLTAIKLEESLPRKRVFEISDTVKRMTS